MKHHDTLTVIIGPSGAGKSTHVGRLLHETNAELVRTKTTRPRRGANDDDTHIFVTPEEFETLKAADEFMGTGAMLGYDYGLPHLPQTDSPKVVLLRAPFVPGVWRQRPDAKVIQIEAPVDQLVERLELRGDHNRADPERLEYEMMMGRKLTSYIVRTDVPLEQSYAAFLRIWNNLQGS